ncbi:hypothetical protein PsorP6_006040 [Peronosclerospora sorghi]|uniref:Uncharacterized protein n=1 Tax=Peronosclerospora sorghi TaxID=230839 RepID=A0ACC0W969_9STRA|nr:hypothetical protein PsorP6_006040 [Peronosclerospora sorghi]
MRLRKLARWQRRILLVSARKHTDTSSLRTAESSRLETYYYSIAQMLSEALSTFAAHSEQRSRSGDRWH